MKPACNSASAHATASLRQHRWWWALTALLCFAGLLLGQSAPRSSTSTATPRLLGENPLPDDLIASPEDFALDRGVGLFVGVNDFVDTSLTPLKFAVNDAIGLAHHFVTTGLVQPAHCHLLVSGQPSGEAAQGQLAELKSRGITLQPANYSNILGAVRTATAVAGSNFIVMSFGTHGFSKEGTIFLMPGDGVRADMDALSITSTRLNERLHASGARKTLLLVDACRVAAIAGVRGNPTQMSDAFRSAFDNAAGSVSFFACDVGQVSYESDEYRHGVFTHYLLSGLRGAAPVDPRGFITLRTLIDYTSDQVRTWVEREKPGASPAERQTPFFHGAAHYLQVPIARSAAMDERIQEIAARRGEAVDLLSAAYRVPALQPIFGVTTYREIQDALASLPPEPQAFDTSALGRIIEMIQLQLARPTRPTVEAVVAWWSRQGRELSQGLVHITTEPLGASIAVDGVDLPEKTPVTRRLPPGQHRLRLHLDGYAPEERPISVEAGREKDLGKIVLRPLPSEARPPATGAPPRLKEIGELRLRTDQDVHQVVELTNGPAELNVSGLPPGLTFDPDRATIVGRPTKTGTYRARITAKGPGGETTASIAFHIEDVERLKAPVVRDAYADILEGEDFEFTIDAEGTVDRYEASGLPAGLRIDRKTGKITGRTNRVGEHTITLSAINEAGRGSGMLDLSVSSTEQTTTPSPKLGATYTFVINGTTILGGAPIYCTAYSDGRIVESTTNTVIGRVTPPFAPNTVAQLDFGAYGYLHLGYDGVLYALIANGYGGWQPIPRGTWKRGG